MPAGTNTERWRNHEHWNDKRLLERLGQAVRGDDGIIKEISDGIVFPILSAMSRFVKQNKSGHWKMAYPKVFKDDDMLIAARRQLKQCDGRPMLMGRSGAAYEGLMTLTEMAERYSAEVQPPEVMGVPAGLRQTAGTPTPPPPMPRASCSKM